MKKIIAVVVAGIILFITIQSLVFIPASAIEYDGRIANASQVESALNGTNTKKKDNLSLFAVKNQQKIYRTALGYVVGEEHDAIDLSYPMFFNDNSGIAFLSDEGVLYNEYFDESNIKKNMIVSQGRLHNNVYRQISDDNFIFFGMSSGLFINTQELVFHTESNDFYLPANCIMNIEEAQVRWYTPVKDYLVYNATAQVNDKTTITIGGKTYSYPKIVKGLGVVKESTVSNLIKSKKSDDTSTSSKSSVVEKPASWRAPSVSVGSFTTTVYSAKSSIYMDDPSGTLKNGRVELQIWKDGKIAARKYLRETQNFTASNLQAGTEYTMIYTYKYKNYTGEYIDVKVKEEVVNTKSFSSLTPIEFSFKNGEIREQSIVVEDITLLTSAKEESVQNISKMSITTGNNTYYLRSSQIRQIIEGKPLTFETDDSISSNQDEVIYTLHVYDSFGNELPIVNNEGKTRTCKQSPKLKLRITRNTVGSIELELDLKNNDNVEMENYRILATNSSGAVLADRALALDETNIKFNNLDAGEIINLQIFADFDVNDGRGKVLDNILAETRVSTVPLSTLGKIYVLSKVKELDDDRAVVTIKLESRTKPALVQLMAEYSISLVAPDGTERTIKLTDEQLEELKAGGTIELEYEGLRSVTEYNLKADSLILHGTKRYTDFDTIFSTKSLKTLRRSAIVETRNFEYTDNTISFDIRVNDLDEAVIDGYVGMRARREDQTEVDLIKIDVTRVDDAESGWIRYTYTAPEDEYKMRPFEFEVYSVEYSRGYRVADRVSNFVLEKYVLYTSRGARATLGLMQIEDKSSTQKRASFVYRIYDQYDVVEDRQVTFVLYKNKERYDSITYTMSGRIMSNEDRPLSFFLPVNSDYTLEIWVHNTSTDKDEKLYSIVFDTYYDVEPIRTVEDLYAVADNPSGHYIVLEDLDITTNPQSIDVPFTGSIDFNGKTLTTAVTDTWRYLFSNNKGELKNVVIYSWYENTTPINSVHYETPLRASSFVLDNDGTISNIFMHFNGTTELANDGIAGIINRNNSGGMLCNFVVETTAPMYCKRNSSFCVAENNGSICDGYIYGESLYATYPNDVYKDHSHDGEREEYIDLNYRKRVGCIVGYNDTSGKVSNVYSLAAVKMASNLRLDYEDLDETAVGTIVGFNNGTVRDSYSVGEEAYEKGALAFGPAVGLNNDDTKTNSNVYYVTDSAHTNNKLNLRVNKTRLYDADFQTDVLNSKTTGQFDTTTYPELGYYPQVKLDSRMPAQKMILLPVLTNSEAVDVKSIEVLEHTDDTAKVKVVLKNPGSGDVMQMKVNNIGTVEIESFEHVGRTTNVIINISNPKGYYSSYGITSVKVKNNYGGSAITRNFSTNEHLIKVDFYRYIHNATEWRQILYNNTTQNYKIVEDIDFSGFTSQVCMTSFSGKIDGMGHTLSNIDCRTSYGLFYYYYGSELKNLTIDTIYGTYLNGLIYYVPSGYTLYMDHVFVNNFEKRSPSANISYTGAFVGRVVGKAYISYSGANNVTFNDNTANRVIGGLVGEFCNGSLTNCYVTGLDVKLKDGGYYYYGTGGLIGYCATTEIPITDCYASGTIEGYTSNVGGLVGYGPRGVINRCFADVDISIYSNIEQSYPICGIMNQVNTSGKLAKNVYTQGDLSNRNVSGTVRRYSNGTADYSSYKIYAAAEQLIDGRKSSTFSPEKITGLLEYADLCKEETLRDTVGLGDNFDYSGVSAGYMPKLKDVDGTLLQGQADVEIKGRPESKNGIVIKDINVVEKTDLSVRIFITIEHEKGIEITGAEFDQLAIEKPSDMTIMKQSDNETVINMLLKPEQYKDLYYLQKITAKRNGEEFTNSYDIRINGCQFYKFISSYDDWQKISNNNENYKLIADIDFTGKGSTMHRNLKVNRFEGVVKADGTYPALQNINLELNGKLIAANTANVFDTVSTNFQNIKIENYTLSFTNPSYYTSSACFIRYAKRYVRNVDIDGMEICKPKNGSDITSTRYCTYAGFIMTGEYYANRISYIHLKNGYVVGKNYVGGILGYSYISNAIEYCVVEDSEIYATGQAGGVRANGYVNYSIAKNTTVEGDYAGGVSGYDGGFLYNYVDSCVITGSTYAGGISGRTRVTTYRNIVYNTRIESKGQGTVGGIAGDIVSNYHIYNNFVDKCNISSATGAAGGVMGAHDYVKASVSCSTSTSYSPKIMHNVISNCTISGAKAGGAAGVWKTEVYGNVIRGTTITGTDCAGGVIGSQYLANTAAITNNLVQADISAPTAGGIIGRFMNDKNTLGTNKNYVSNNMIQGGTITGSNYAGGLVGAVAPGKELSIDTNEPWKNNLIISTSIVGSLYGGAVQVGNGNTGLSEFELGTIQGTNVHESVKIDNTAIGEYKTSAYYRSILVKKAALSTTSYYTDRGFRDNYHGSIYTPTWQINGYVNKSDGNYMPIGGMASEYTVTIGTVNNITINGINYKTLYGKTAKLIDKQIELGLIPLPNDLPVMLKMAMMSRGNPTLDDYEVYPVDVDKINVEFGSDMTGTEFYINDDSSTKYQINGRVITLGYDFSSSLKLSVVVNGNTYDVEINPTEYRRKVMLYGDEYYYIKDDGTLYNSKGVIEGSYIHLYKGKALKADGSIKDLGGGSTDKATHGTVQSTASALQAYSYLGSDVQVFGSYSLVDGSTVRAMQIFNKNGLLSSVSKGLNNVKDSVVIDSYQNANYQVVLGTDGVMYDLKTETKKPEDFDNKSIKYIASNLDSNSHYIIVEYETGAVYGFDYITGEELFNVGPTKMNFLTFAKSFLAAPRASVSMAAPTAYAELQTLQGQLEETPVDELLAATEDKDADTSSSGTGVFGSDVQYIANYDADNKEYVLYSSADLFNTSKAEVQSENAKIAASPELEQYYATPTTKLNIRTNLQGIILVTIALFITLCGVLFLIYRRNKMD